MSAAGRQLLIAFGIFLVALLFVGFLIGAIGSAMFGAFGDEPFLHTPEVHIAPQPVFPAEKRDEHLGLTHHEEGAEGEEAEPHAIPLGFTEFAITNTLLSAWLTSLVLILFFVGGARKKNLIPGRFQNLVEMFVEGLLNFASTIVGPELARRSFPIVGSIFFFVLFNAWIAIFLLPLYQAVGFMYEGELKVHLVRAAGTDLNMPLALALASFAVVEYFGIRYLGLGYFGKFFNFRNLLRGNIFQGLIDIFVGLLELVSELVRIVSFTFRLFGNMTAGEILIIMFTFLVPFVASQIVFGLELLVGLIQSVIFAGLTLVFLALATTGHHEEEHHH